MLSLPSLNSILTIVVMTLMVASLVLWITMKDWHTQEMANVRVVSRDSDYRFTAEVLDPDNGHWNRFTFISCPDYIPSPEITGGVTLSLLKYEERPGCMEIGRPNLGYILRRDKDGHPIITNAGQAAPRGTP